MTIDALEWLDEIEARTIHNTSYMYGVESFYDGPCAHNYDPRIHADQLGVPVAINDTLPRPDMVACYSKKHNAIFVRPHLHSHVERCAIAHEIVHYEHQDVGTSRHQEERADRIAARRLVRPSLLEEIAHLTDDYGRIALELGVTEKIMRAYLKARHLA